MVFKSFKHLSIVSMWLQYLYNNKNYVGLQCSKIWEILSIIDVKRVDLWIVFAEYACEPNVI